MYMYIAGIAAFMMVCTVIDLRNKTLLPRRPRRAVWGLAGVPCWMVVGAAVHR